MAWFKVDDGLHSHPKVIKAGDAIALWVLAGSWCAGHLTDGFVPEYMANRLVMSGTTYAATLVRVGLWVPAERDGEKGWQFHDWSDMQPSREQVKAAREASADRQRRWRERRSAGRNAVTPPSTNGATASVSTPVSDGPTNGVSAPSPTRPDPTAPSGQGRVGRGDPEGAGVELDQEGIKQRLAERAYAGGQTDDTVKNEKLAEMRSKLPPGRPLSRWQQPNGEPQ